MPKVLVVQMMIPSRARRCRRRLLTTASLVPESTSDLATEATGHPAAPRSRTPPPGTVPSFARPMTAAAASSRSQLPVAVAQLGCGRCLPQQDCVGHASRAAGNAGGLARDGSACALCRALVSRPSRPPGCSTFHHHTASSRRSQAFRASLHRGGGAPLTEPPPAAAGTTFTSRAPRRPRDGTRNAARRTQFCRRARRNS